MSEVLVRRGWSRVIASAITAVQSVGMDVAEIHVGERQYRELTDGTLRLAFRDDLGPESIYGRPMRLVESPDYLGFVTAATNGGDS